MKSFKLVKSKTRGEELVDGKGQVFAILAVLSILVVGAAWFIEAHFYLV